MKKFILNADDLGLSINHNKAVKKGYVNGVLRNASLIVNCDAFNDVVDNVIRHCPKLNVAIHLNIMEGKSLTYCPSLTDKNGFFNKGYLYLILNQYNKKVQKQIENEFKAQIEKALQNGIEIKRMDSHVHTHAIPEIFKISCKLAKEYNIGYIRTQFEKPYLVFPKCCNIKFLINIIKILILNFFTLINKKTLEKYNLEYNDYILGVGYTAMMNSKTVLEGAKSLKNKDNKTIEIVIHPCIYDDDNRGCPSEEFLITQDKSLNAKYLNNI